jgi:hypothetical protein
MVAVYRAPMRSGRDDVGVAETHDRAFTLGLCGFGDAAEDPRFDRRVARFTEVADGSYAWTLDVDGLYRLGRIDGPYRHDASAAAAAVDLVHVRACTWLPDPLTEAAVPAAVVATFARGGRNFQQTHDAAVGSETERIWAARQTGRPPSRA